MCPDLSYQLYHDIINNIIFILVYVMINKVGRGAIRAWASIASATLTNLT